MLEDVFLTYANYPLREYPEKLIEMFGNFEDNNVSFTLGVQQSIHSMMNHFVSIIKTDNIKLSKKMRRKVKSKHDRAKREFDLAFEAVYGFRDGYCEKSCFDNARRKELIGGIHYYGPARLHCYECDQFFFKRILAGIIEGKEFSEIGTSYRDLEVFMSHAYHNIEKSVYIAPAEKTGFFKEQLKDTILFEPRDLLSDARDIRRHFNRYLITLIVAYSLSEFLLHQGRQKIRVCKECEQIFTSKTTRQSSFCSDKCRLTWHNRKRIESGEAKEYKRKKRLEARIAKYQGQTKLFKPL